MKDLYIITGFLGAGKTTLVNRAAEAFSDRRIAVIVNEFGKQGVDGMALSEKGYDVTEIVNGSIFCVCRMDMFMDTLIQAAGSPAELLIVETSGLSNPASIQNILAATQAVCGQCFEYRGCICMVDALHFEKVHATAVVIPDQIRSSSLVLINKTDLATPRQVAKTEEIIRGLHPDCIICRTTYAEIPRDMLTDLKPVPDQLTGSRQDVSSGTLTFQVRGRPDLESFCRLMDSLKNRIYRCKGYVSLRDATYYVDGVMDCYTLSRVEKEYASGIVLLYNTSGHVRKTLVETAGIVGISIELE